MQLLCVLAEGAAAALSTNKFASHKFRLAFVVLTFIVIVQVQRERAGEQLADSLFVMQFML